MTWNHDQNLLESVRIHRGRLQTATMLGSAGRHRTVGSLTRRLIVGLVIAALVAAICVGVGFVQQVLRQQAAERAKLQHTSQAWSPTDQHRNITEGNA